MSYTIILTAAYTARFETIHFYGRICFITVKCSEMLDVQRIKLPEGTVFKHLV